MIVAGYSYVTIVRTKDVVVDPSDMNVILITLLSHPQSEISSMKLCLSKMAEDGFLFLTASYITPDIAVVFVCLDADETQGAQTKRIAREIKEKDLVAEVAKAVESNYAQKMTIAPNGKLAA